MIDLKQVMTFSEAAQKWGFANGNTLRKAVERKKFNEDEVRKSGDVWLTTYDAMVRVFGLPKINSLIIPYTEFIDIAVDSIYDKEAFLNRLEQLFEQMRETIANHQPVTIIERASKPDHIVYIMVSEADLHDFMQSTKRYYASTSGFDLEQFK